MHRARRASLEVSYGNAHRNPRPQSNARLRIGPRIGRRPCEARAAGGGAHRVSQVSAPMGGPPGPTDGAPPPRGAPPLCAPMLRGVPRAAAAPRARGEPVAGSAGGKGALLLLVRSQIDPRRGHGRALTSDRPDRRGPGYGPRRVGRPRALLRSLLPWRSPDAYNAGGLQNSAGRDTRQRHAIAALGS